MLIEEILTGVGPRNLETAISIANLLVKNNISMEKFAAYGKKYMLGKRLALQEENKYRTAMSKLFCPECGSSINVIRISVPKGKQNRKGWQSLVQCRNCIYEHYSKMEAQKKIAQLLKQARRA